MDRCALCGRKLIQFKENDWTSRKYHKVCFRKMNEEAYYMSFTRDLSLALKA